MNLEVEVLGGRPSPAEAEAARAAVLALWREDVAAAARAGGLSAWTAAMRADATRRTSSALRGRTSAAWRWAGRLGETISPISIGRGDAR